jgi:tetratricopeptide (TPR) repeat protein
MFRRSIACVAIALSASAWGASDALQEAYDLCNSGREFTTDRRAACDRVIAAKGLPKRQYAVVHAVLGNALKDDGDIPRAMVEYAEASRIDPTYTFGYNNRGALWNLAGEPRKALPFFDKAIEVYKNLDKEATPAPKYAEIYRNRGATFIKLGEFKKAIADYDEALRIHPQSSGAYQGRASAWEEAGELDKALADYDQALRIDPKDSWGYQGRALVWERKGDYDRAIADNTEALRANPGNIQVLNNRAVVWERKKESTKAMDDYSEAIRRSPSFPMAYKNRGMLREKLGEHDAAIADFDQAIRLIVRPPAPAHRILRRRRHQPHRRDREGRRGRRQPALGITDLNNLFGAIKFYKEGARRRPEARGRLRS